MLEDEKYLNKDAIQLRIVRMLVWMVLGIVLIFFTSVSGCVMYSNSIGAEQTRAETEQIKEKSKIEKEKIDIISALIDKGINPITARCAIIGYTVASHLHYGQQDINPCGSYLNTDIKQGEKLK